MTSKLIAFILPLIIALLALTSSHASSLRCGVRLITVGDFKARVLAECGEPDHVEIWEEERVYKFRHHPGYYGIYENYEYSDRNYEYGQPYRIRKLVLIEEWTYNHGPGRFMDHLRLENGIVRGIKSGDYGY
jgi:squalene cyclase